MWEIYGNGSGKSGIHAYQIGEDYCTVKFTTGAVYTYTYDSAGKSNIEFLKRLLQFGFGANGYIIKHLKKSYASKG